MIDARAPGIDLAPLGALLADPAVVKVFHAARQDVEIFLERFGAVPVPIFDTQVAAMVAGFGDQVGYDALVSALTGGQIDKAHRFSDWAARPLSPPQIAYAAADVTYLRLVYTSLCERLERDGRLEWVREEMDVLAEPGTYRADPETLWERLRPRTNNRRMLGLLRAAVAWREREAQRINIPRQRLIKDESLLEIAAVAADHAGRARPHPRRHPRLRRGQDRRRPVAALERGRRPARDQLPPAPRGRDGAQALAGPGLSAESAARRQMRGASRGPQASRLLRGPRPAGHRRRARPPGPARLAPRSSSARTRWRSKPAASRSAWTASGSSWSESDRAEEGHS